MYFDVHFWEALCFALFVLLAYRPVKQALSDHLDEYSKAIEQKVIEVENLRKEAEKTFKYYTEQHKAFIDKIASSSKQAEENILLLKQEAAKKLEERIEVKRKIQQDKLDLYDKEETDQIKKAIINKTMTLVTCYLEDSVTPNLTKNQISQLLNTTKNKSITFH